MPRTVEQEPLEKHVLRLYAGDFDKLAGFFPELGPSVAVRRIVRSQIKKLESGVAPIPEMKDEIDV